MPSQEASGKVLWASGLPAPFSIRDKVEADTPVCSATSRKLKPCCSRRRRTAPPSSEVLTPVFFAMPASLPPFSFSCKTMFYRRNTASIPLAALGLFSGGLLPPQIRFEDGGQ